jgi:aldose 1-epimerase
MTTAHTIHTYTLTNRLGNTVQVLDRGLILKSVLIGLADGSMRECVLGFDHAEDYASPIYLASYPCLGAIVGRYANRIKNAEFELDGQQYFLQANNGPHCLHGGLEGFDKKQWQVEPLDNQTLKANYNSIDGEEGFPGNLQCQALIRWTDDNSLELSITCRTDKPTPVNITWHPYFNLDESKSSIGLHQLQLSSDRYLVQEQDLVPTGTIASTIGTPLEFSHLTPLQKAIEIGGIDTSFVIQSEDDEAVHLAARLISSDQKIELLIYSTAPIVHLYTAGSLPVLDIANGRKSGPFHGVCLECQDYTDAVHHPQFPNTILRPDEVYERVIIHRFVAST